ncbi:MAG: butyrate kinase [Clostridiales bacterium]|nr:butyrate kinase [Clostridiales bacterium]
MEYHIFAVNPGSTSTKIGLFKNETELWVQNLEHGGEDLRERETIGEQLAYRRDRVLEALNQKGLNMAELSAVVGRGGMLPPVKAGGYTVNQCMRDRLQKSRIGFHASNLGALIADSIAVPLGIPAYIYDAVSADELYDIAHITGIPEVYRQSFCHVLNAKATCRKAAKKRGKRYQDMNFLVGHLGGGISISAHERGRIVDVITDDAGPFSPERSGSIPLRTIVDMCYSNKYEHKEMLYKLRGMGGLKAHFGFHDCRRIEEMIEAGDVYAKAVYEAFAYQISKGIGELAPVLKGQVDAVVLTGGVAYSKMITDWVRERVSFIAEVEVIPGENELESLALGALRILKGEEPAHEYLETPDTGTFDIRHT